MKNSVGLTAEIYGILAGVPIKFNMPNPDGCRSSNITCPVKSGDEYTYSGLFNVIPTYPNVSIQKDVGRYLAYIELRIKIYFKYIYV